MCENTFTQRIVNIWNSLPEHVVNSSSVGLNSFKNNLDKFFVSQEVYYNFKCDTTGTGNTIQYDTIAYWHSTVHRFASVSLDPKPATPKPPNLAAKTIFLQQ